MNKDKQRIAIAEACGIAKPVYHTKDIKWGGKNPGTHISDVPDYLASIDAMHKAEKVAPKSYWLTLLSVVGAAGFAAEWQKLKAVSSATAAQRAEAFLKACNLWTDDK
jgi:hypothetical protein